MNKAIEVLKDFVRAMKEANCYPKRIEALTQAIQWGEALQSAGRELPEKKIVKKVETYLPTLRIKEYEDDKEDLIFNQALDLCKPILAKKDLSHKTAIEVYEDNMRDNEKELATLKKKLTESKKSL